MTIAEFTTKAVEDICRGVDAAKENGIRCGYPSEVEFTIYVNELGHVAKRDEQSPVTVKVKFPIAV